MKTTKLVSKLLPANFFHQYHSYAQLKSKVKITGKPCRNPDHDKHIMATNVSCEVDL